MGLFSNMRRNLEETRQIQMAMEETKQRYLEHFKRHEADLMRKMNEWIQQEMGKALSAIEKGYPVVYKKHNNFAAKLVELYKEMGLSGFEEGCLDPWGDNKKMWSKIISIEIFLEDNGITTKAVIDEYLAGATRVYNHCHTYGHERELPQNFEIRRRSW